MKAFASLVVLLLIIPMAVLNPMGREAFLGYYAGIIAAWAAFVIACRYGQLPDHSPDGPTISSTLHA